MTEHFQKSPQSPARQFCKCANTVGNTPKTDDNLLNGNDFNVQKIRRQRIRFAKNRSSGDTKEAGVCFSVRFRRTKTVSCPPLCYKQFRGFGSGFYRIYQTSDKYVSACDKETMIVFFGIIEKGYDHE